MAKRTLRGQDLREFEANLKRITRATERAINGGTLADGWSLVHVLSEAKARAESACANTSSTPRRITSGAWVLSQEIAAEAKPLINDLHTRSSVEYWFDRCIKQEEALDACIVATVGPRKGEPMVTVPNRADIHEADIVWDGPEAKTLIDAALKARR